MVAQNFLLEPLDFDFLCCFAIASTKPPTLPTPSGGVASTGHDSYQHLFLPPYGTRNFIRAKGALWLSRTRVRIIFSLPKGPCLFSTRSCIHSRRTM